MLKNRSRILRRLSPLYAAAFCHGFMLWYVVEKLFMKSIGFNDATIGLMVALYSVFVLLTETPSGILADRWSRKGVLMLASASLGICVIIGGFSQNVPTYMICTCLWGVFFALYSGTYESIVYDTVYEETGSSVQYEKYYGWIRSFDSIALATSSLLGALIGSWLGLRSAYFLSLIPVVLSIVALAIFREPRLHKLEVASPIIQHVRETFAAVLRNKHTELRSVLVVLITITVSSSLLLEFNQLWYIALAVPVIAFGPLNASLLATLGLGGVVAPKINMSKVSTQILFIGVFIGSALIMVFSRNVVLSAFGMASLAICIMALEIIFSRMLQDALSSKVRAGATSAISTMGWAIVIPASLLFGYISNSMSVFDAAWVQVGLTVVAALFIVKAFTQPAPRV